MLYQMSILLRAKKILHEFRPMIIMSIKSSDCKLHIFAIVQFYDVSSSFFIEGAAGIFSILRIFNCSF